jgi:hypothetical protein
LKSSFPLGPVHLPGWYVKVRDPGLINPRPTIGLPLRDALHLFANRCTLFIPSLPDDRLIPLDPVDRALMRLFVHLPAGVHEPLPVHCVILDHRVAYDRCRAIGFDDCGTVYIGQPDTPVIVHLEEIAPVDHNGVA